MVEYINDQLVGKLLFFRVSMEWSRISYGCSLVNDNWFVILGLRRLRVEDRQREGLVRIPALRDFRRCSSRRLTS